MNGKSITEKQMEEYIEKYICHIKKYNVKYFFEMDVDCIFGLEKVEIWRKKIENQTGIKSIPVWHKSRGIDYFKRMVDEYDYIAIGGFANGDIKNKNNENTGRIKVTKKYIPPDVTALRTILQLKQAGKW